jgi:hypothetical protein
VAIRYIGKWGGSPDGESPTLWLDDETGDWFMQGYREEDPAVVAELLRTAGLGQIPQGEALIRFPHDMADLFLEASGERDGRPEDSDPR